MKVVKVGGQLFTIFAYLTLGSLFILVSLHLISLDDAILKLREVYASPWKSTQVGLLGLVFILIGLAFSKILVKMGPQNEALICQSERGPVVISGKAIEDVAKKVVRKSPFVKDVKQKLNIEGRDVFIKLRVVLWAGGSVTDNLLEIQTEVQRRLEKLLGEENKIEVSCDVIRIDDSKDLSLQT